MRFADIAALVGHVPFIPKDNAQFLYDLIIKEKLLRILELGIAHGTATCYMAAALQELGGGLITCVDLIAAKDIFTPSAEEQLASTGLSKFAEVIRMQTGYTWFLHDDIRKHTENDKCKEVYDLCIIDGPKNWTIDGAAFFLADKLLKKHGWIIFDDFDWTYADADKRRDATDGITHRSLSADERKTPHIREIFDLVVKQHQNYSNFSVLNKRGWALAQKVKSDNKTYTIVHRNEDSYKDVLARVFHKMKRTLALQR